MLGIQKINNDDIILSIHLLERYLLIFNFEIQWKQVVEFSSFQKLYYFIHSVRKNCDLRYFIQIYTSSDNKTRSFEA